MENKLKIALTFSGGGYRAATFHLGTLSYLHTVKIGESTFLEQVVAMSTISGGTITGLCYMLGLTRGESVDEIFKDLYHFFIKIDLASIAMDNLSSYEEGQCIVYAVLKKKLVRIAKTTVLQDSVPSVLNLRFKDIATLVANRVNSVLLLVSSVFMKHLHRMGVSQCLSE